MTHISIRVLLGAVSAGGCPPTQRRQDARCSSTTSTSHQRSAAWSLMCQPATLSQILTISTLDCRSSVVSASTNSYGQLLMIPCAAFTLMHAFITSHVDYCNAVLYGVPAIATLLLQWSPVFTVTVTLHDTLRWLSVPQRILFTVALLAAFV